MSKHTPGPWRWGKEYEGIYGRDDEEVMTHQKYEGMWLSYGENQKGNARLIAAAPDLLEALQEMIQGIEEECHEPSCAECLPWRKARAAIAKATGEQA